MFRIAILLFLALSVFGCASNTVTQNPQPEVTTQDQEAASSTERVKINEDKKTDSAEKSEEMNNNSDTTLSKYIVTPVKTVADIAVFAVGMSMITVGYILFCPFSDGGLCEK